MLTIASLLSRRAARQGDHLALVDEATGDRWTVSALDRASAAVAAVLQDAGVGQGDRIGLLGPNHPSFVVTYLAVARLGAVLVPLNVRLTAPELAGIAGDAGLGGLVAHTEVPSGAAVADALGLPPGRCWAIGPGGDLEATIAAAAAGGAVTALAGPPPGPDDLLYLMYTSGTTGRPKGAMHTHATTVAAAVGAVEAMDYRPGDRYLNVLPLFHVASLAMVNICLYRRCTMVLGRDFDPARAWRTIAEQRVDAMMGVPVMLAAMLGARDPDLDTSSLRVLSTGAAPVPRPLLEAYRDLGIDIVQAYGLTEAGGAVSVLDAADAGAHLGTAGKPLLDVELRIAGPGGGEAPPGTAGEIQVRGPSTSPGYWGLTDERPDGWFATGDVGVVDEAGFLTVVDRLKDMVISGGENVYPAEVESVLSGHPAIADVAVIGQPSDRWGESPCAVVVPADGFDPADLRAWAAERLAPFKQPRAIEVVDELPRNASGKVLKHVLRDRFPGPAPA
ncbi:MAG TPA: AMP-binding protein [Iamia sp.]|nr:AMP-binding protein [Iamia sp.]